MDPTLHELLNLVFRWVHLAAGALWVGHLYFFNFVHAQLARTYDAESKKKVVPELMPRALYFFRWGAAWTWTTGLLLLGLVYYHGGAHARPEGGLADGPAAGLAVASLAVGFAVYDLLWRAVKDEKVGLGVSFLLIAAYAFGLSRVLSGRSTIMHVGALFGTIMAANVWMRIWPAQRRIIAGVKGTAAAPDPAVPALAALRSKHNTYLSVPLLFTMVASHFPTVYGSDLAWAWMLLVVVAGWGAVKFLYTKAASAAPAQF